MRKPSLPASMHRNMSMSVHMAPPNPPPCGGVNYNRSVTELPHTVSRPDDERQTTDMREDQSALRQYLAGRHKKSIFSRVVAYFRETKEVPGKKPETDADDMDTQMTRCKPESLDVLVTKTKFNRKELQMMYRGFKQECPAGAVNEDTFRNIYGQFFPQGDSSGYAHFVFKTFDQNRTGTITFEEFVVGLSALARGTMEDKLQWAFSLYDINRDGVVSKDEMLEIISSIYAMMGSCVTPYVDEKTAAEHVDAVFQKMDLNKDGLISYDEFMEACAKDDTISRSLAVLDTQI